MEFVIRIVFSGMMVFIPNADNTQLDVVLLNVGHNHSVSDGTSLAQHKAILLARSGNCTGGCPRRDDVIAAYLFGDKLTPAAMDALESALAGGAAWRIDGSQISLAKVNASDPNLPALTFTTGVRNGIIPTTSLQRGDYTWLAKLSELCPDCGLNEDVLASQPPSNLVAARFRLQSGNVFTYSIARNGTNVTPVQFRRLDGDGNPAQYSQAVATWMAADINVTGTGINIVESKFDGSTGRTMTLTPDANNRIELAVLNLPELVSTTPAAAAGVGKHFQAFYEISENVPAPSTRLVPQVATSGSWPQVTWTSIHPPDVLWSDLLNDIRLGIGRSLAEVILCPPAEP